MRGEVRDDSANYRLSRRHNRPLEFRQTRRTQRPRGARVRICCSKMRILRILKGTTVDGPGFRTSVYFAGCAHHCAGCHNPGSWDFTGGEDTSIDQLMGTVEEEDFDVTLSGGDPLYQPEDVAELCRRVARLGHTVWIYTGINNTYANTTSIYS